MHPDDGLRALFRNKLPPPGCWTTIETGGRGSSGVPDAFYQAPGHVGVWVEFKSVKTGRAISFQPAQAAWLLSHHRMNGHAVIAVRRRCSPGPRREAQGARSARAACDELHLFDGSQVKQLMQHGLPRAPWDKPQSWLTNEAARLGVWRGGPAKWDWIEIRATMLR
jgi:hypothetical protein